MYNLDKDFYKFTSNIKNMTIDEIYNNIKFNFSLLPSELQKNFENYFTTFNYWGSLNIENNDYNVLYEKAKYLHDNIDDIIWLYEKLNDYRSKKLLYGIINNWYNYDFTTLKETKEILYKHYFDMDLVNPDSETVFVDLGAYIGDSVTDYINTYGENYKKIYCYEITDLTYSLLKNNLSRFDNVILRKKAVGDEEKYVTFTEHNDISSNSINKNGTNKIEQVTLDKDIKEKISIIKMDIEGSEVNALIGSENHIKNDTPTLLISLYHRNSDLTNIPRLIDKFNDNYDFYLRSKSGETYPTEIILICVKKQLINKF